MAKAGVLASLFIVSVLYGLKSASAKTQKMTAQGFDIGRPIETACFEADTSFQDDTSHMYVGVPAKLFHIKHNGGENTCGKKITVSCSGGKDVCKNHKAVELTIIDTLDGDFVEISNKAFNIISDFDIGIIDVVVTTEF
ncbi:hypothetical protein Mapa_003044 [Marchantia paleacea]|nr:hypothetical protein Mapa_003044 [Marchantia paleacea]